MHVSVAAVTGQMSSSTVCIHGTITDQQFFPIQTNTVYVRLLSQDASEQEFVLQWLERIRVHKFDVVRAGKYASWTNVSPWQHNAVYVER